MSFIVFWIIGGAAGVISAILNPEVRSLHAICSNLLFYQMVITVSASGLWGFAGHVFKSNEVARSIGWESSPFQKELGYCELGIGVSGIACIWQGPEFWLCTIIIFTSLFMGAACLHLKELILENNFNKGNVITMIPDLLIPLSLIVLYICS